MRIRKPRVESLSLLLLLIGCADNRIGLSSTPTGATSLSPQTYHAYGDSITAGFNLADSSLAYPNLIAGDRKLPLSRYANVGDQACDVPTRQIFPNRDSPSAASEPLYTLLIGTNDGDLRGPGNYEAIFKLCHQATIAWLGLPIERKVLATASSVTSSGGTGINPANNWNAWEANQPGASISFPITLLAPGPIYLWPRLVDSNPGAYSYALDGTVVGSLTTGVYPGVQTQNGSTDSFALIRLPNIAAGRHVVTFTQTSSQGTVGIVAVGAPTAATGTLPTVVVGNVPLQQPGSGWPCASVPTRCDAYTADILADTSLLAADGLDVRYVDTHAYLHATPSEMADGLHPNNLGQSELRTAFEAAIP